MPKVIDVCSGLPGFHPGPWPWTGGCVVLALLGMNWGGLTAADDPPPEKKKEERKEMGLVAQGRSFVGYPLRPATKEGFEFEVKGSGEKIFFTWEMLPEGERRQMRTFYGIAEEASGDLWGGKVSILRITMKSGKTVEGVEVPERAQAGHRCLRKAKMLMQIPVDQIEIAETIEKRESEIYSAREVYERMLVEDPPKDDSANDHLAYVRKLAEMRLYGPALEHLKMANTIDPRTVERTEELGKELQSKLDNQQATELHSGFIRDLQKGEFAGALDKLDQFTRAYPGHELLAAMEAKRPELEKKKAENFRGLVAQMFYTLVGELISAKLAAKIKVDEQGRPVPPVPGKQICLKSGAVYRGPLVEEDEEKLTIKQEGAENKLVVIKRGDIQFVKDVDLSQARRLIAPSFATLQAWVTNADGGLGKEIVVRISSSLKVDEASVREAWEKRFDHETVIQDGTTKVTPTYARTSEAEYGEGTWLRGTGAAGGKNPKGRAQTRNPQQRPQGGKQDQPSAGNLVFPDAQKALAEANNSDDPEVWWSVQKSELKLRILKAMAGESIFKLKNEIKRSCPGCSGQGFIEELSATGQRTQRRCPTCRGQKHLIKIVYE